MLPVASAWERAAVLPAGTRASRERFSRLRFRRFPASPTRSQRECFPRLQTSKSYFRCGHRCSESRVSGISSISRIKGIAWNTVARWLEKAAQVCHRFNHRRIAGFAAKELQADEIRTFAGNKKTPSWVFVTIEVWSRLWPSRVTGRRSYRNTHALLREPFEADEFRASSLDRHGWIRILPEGHPSSFFGPALSLAGRCCTARSKSLTSLCRLQSHPAQYVSGIPSAAILLSISHPIRCSTRCLANVRARISGPMIAL